MICGIFVIRLVFFVFCKIFLFEIPCKYVVGQKTAGNALYDRVLLAAVRRLLALYV